MRREKDLPRLQPHHLQRVLSPQREQQQKYHSHTNYCDCDGVLATTKRRRIPPPAEESPTTYWRDPELKRCSQEERVWKKSKYLEIEEAMSSQPQQQKKKTMDTSRRHFGTHWRWRARNTSSSTEGCHGDDALSSPHVSGLVSRRRGAKVSRDGGTSLGRHPRACDEYDRGGGISYHMWLMISIEMDRHPLQNGQENLSEDWIALIWKADKLDVVNRKYTRKKQPKNR